MRSVLFLVLLCAVLSSGLELFHSHSSELHDDHAPVPVVPALSLAEVAAQADADWEHHAAAMQDPNHASLAGLYALRRQAVADSMSDEPCFPKPCVGARSRRRANLAAAVVKVPVPVPVYVNKVRVVKVNTDKLNKKNQPQHLLLKVEQPPVYASQPRRFKNSVIEADKRGLVEVTRKITNRRQHLDRYDHWMLDANRAVDVVKHEIKHTQATKSILKTQIAELLAMRERWTNKLKADELTHDIGAAKRHLALMEEQAGTAEVTDEQMAERAQHVQAQLDQLTQQQQQMANTPQEHVDMEELEQF